MNAFWRRKRVVRALSYKAIGIRRRHAIAAVVVGLLGAFLALYLLSAARPIPVSTMVTIYKPREIDLAGLPQSVLLVASDDAGDLTRVSDAATYIWESIAQEGVGTSLTLHKRDSVVTTQLDIDGGSDEAVIAKNLDRLKSATGGTWERVGDDYVFCLGESGRSGLADAVSAGGTVPPLAIYSPDLARTCAFLKRAFGIRIYLRGTEALSVVRQADGESYGAHDPEGGQLHFRTDEPLSLRELVHRLAWFHGASLIRSGDGYAIVDASSDDLRRRVRAMVTDPDGFNWLPADCLPRHASKYLKEFLVPSGGTELWRALDILSHLDARQVVPELLLLLQQKEALWKLSQSELLRNLARAGHSAALPELERTQTDCIHPSEAVLLAGCVRTEQGAITQHRLLERYAERPIVSPGTMETRELPDGVSVEDAHAIEVLALAYIHAFLQPASGEPEARGFLAFTHEGQRADYCLDLGNHTPPWTYGNLETVSLERTGGLWFIVAGSGGGHWDGFDGPEETIAGETEAEEAE